MPDFKPSEDILSLSEFRTTLADCVARTRDTHRPIILTQNGRASSVFLDVADWEKIAEKLYHAELCEDLIVGEGEIERGETYTADDVGKLICQAHPAKDRRAYGFVASWACPQQRTGRLSLDRTRASRGGGAISKHNRG